MFVAKNIAARLIKERSAADDLTFGHKKTDVLRSFFLVVVLFWKNHIMFSLYTKLAGVTPCEGQMAGLVVANLESTVPIRIQMLASRLSLSLCEFRLCVLVVLGDPLARISLLGRGRFRPRRDLGGALPA